MFIEFLRTNKYASIFITVLRLYIGYEWITAGYEKLSGTFDATGFLQGAVAKASGGHPVVQSWWAGFLQHVVLPNVTLFNYLIPWGEFLVGVALILGLLPRTAVFFGLLMNFSFMFSGTTSINPQLVLLSMFVLLAGENAGKWGINTLFHKYGASKFPKKL